jgi:hypothetical protein
LTYAYFAFQFIRDSIGESIVEGEWKNQISKIRLSYRINLGLIVKSQLHLDFDLPGILAKIQQQI